MRSSKEQLADVDDFDGLLRPSEPPASGSARSSSFHSGGHGRRGGFRRFWSYSTMVVALIRHVMPAILERKATGDTVRIWIPECATGESAYSLAMVVIDYVDRMQLGTDVRVFATDLDPSALALARRSTYSAEDVRAFLPERFERFLAHDADRVRVSKRVRDSIVFSSHDFFADAPLSNLDIVWCGGLTIGRSPELAARMFPLLSHAIVPAGFLCMSSSDRLVPPPRSFVAVPGVKRLFQRAASRTDKLISIAAAAVPEADTLKPKARRRSGDDRGALGEALLLRKYAPPSAIVDEMGQILRLVGDTADFIAAPAGVVTRNLIELARPALRPALQRCLNLSTTHRRTVATDELEMDSGPGGPRITVTPIIAGKTAPSEYVVVFEPRSQDATPQAATAGSLREQLDEAIQELRRSREEFQFCIEEVRSENEELLSANEELRASNESLETVIEELRTIGDDAAQTVTESTAKLDALARCVADEKATLEDIGVPTLVLDWQLKVVGFTRSITELFRLIDADVGRPITDIAPLFSCEAFVEDARDVLRGGAERTLSVESRAGTHYMVRMRASGRHEPAVTIAFFDAAQKESLTDTEQQNSIELVRSFSAEIAHELKDPLNVISLSAELGARAMESGEQASQYFDTIRAAASRSGRLLQSILSMARNEMPEMSRVDVHALLKRAASLMPNYVKTPPEITWALDADGGAVCCNALVLEQVFVNLLKNSVEATRPRLSKIRIGSKLAGDKIVIGVSDDGPGISSKDADQVFNRFYSRRRGGTGVGLSLARHALAIHRGAIRLLKPSEGGGTTFEVELPLAPT
jgi:signal transduction histidine kinase/chemotaxis methyl-accepting protein methylase